MILQNQVKCLKCGDKPFSRHRHDFRPCKCGAVTVDGGLAYLRRLFQNVDDVEEMSIEVEQEVFADLMEAMDRKETNNLGKICEIMRVLRDAGHFRPNPNEGASRGYQPNDGPSPRSVEAGLTEGLCP